jgi:hypothetical protein
MGSVHGLINYKDTKTINVSLLVFNRVYRLELLSVMLVFSTGFVNSNPLTSLISSPPFPPLPCVNKYTVYRYTMSKGESMGS